MRFLCFGAGAIGSYVGGSLLLGGHSVVFVEQPAFLPLLREQGIQIQDVHGEVHHTAVTAVASAAEALADDAPFDAAIFAVKSFDTAALMQSLAPLATQLPSFICLQNGVENEEVIADALGAGHVLPVSVCTAISRERQGSIRVEKLRGIGIAAGHPLSKGVEAAFTEAGLKPALVRDGTAMKWSKMISNLLANASSAILDMTPAEIFADSVGFELEICQIRETLRVMRAYGIRPVNIPGVPIRLLCAAVEHLPKALSKPALQKAVGGGRGGKMPSFHIDLYAGKKQSEVEYLNGAVVRYADAKGIPVPVNRAFYEILTQLTNGTLPLNTYKNNPQKLASVIPMGDGVPTEGMK